MSISVPSAVPLGWTHPVTGRWTREPSVDGAGRHSPANRREAARGADERFDLCDDCAWPPPAATVTLALALTVGLGVAAVPTAVGRPGRRSRGGHGGGRPAFPSQDAGRPGQGPRRAQAAHDVGAIKARLLLANQRLEQATLRAEQASEAYNGAMWHLEQARQPTGRPGRRRARPPYRRRPSATGSARLVAQSYQNGGDLTALQRDDERRRPRGRPRPVRRLPGRLDVAAGRLQAVRRHRRRSPRSSRARPGTPRPSRSGSPPRPSRPSDAAAARRRRPGRGDHHRRREGPADPRARAGPAHLGRPGPHSGRPRWRRSPASGPRSGPGGGRGRREGRRRGSRPAAGRRRGGSEEEGGRAGRRGPAAGRGRGGREEEGRRAGPGPDQAQTGRRRRRRRPRRRPPPARRPRRRRPGPRAPGTGPAPPAPAPSGGAPRAIAFAKAQLGEPYRWGATGPSSWDCSGLTMRRLGARPAGRCRTTRSRSTTPARPISVGRRCARATCCSGARTGSPAASTTSRCTSAAGRFIQAPHTGANVRYRLDVLLVPADFVGPRLTDRL